MTSFALNAPTKQAPTFSAWVWYENKVAGVGDALKEGQAVCHNWDYGTATDFDARRFNHVELPTTLNAQYFAGVCARNYAADAGGQMIEIYLPGSVCNIYVAVTTVKGVGILTFDVTPAFAGQFRYAGLEGEGSAQPMQNTTYAAAAQKCMAKLQTGLPSGGVEVVDLVDDAAIGTLMLAGTTLITGSVIGTGNCIYTLADGTFTGQRKKFKIIDAEVQTSSLIITVTTGFEVFGAGDLDTITWTDAAVTLGTSCTVVWDDCWNAVRLTIDVPALA